MPVRSYRNFLHRKQGHPANPLPPPKHRSPNHLSTEDSSQSKRWALYCQLCATTTSLRKRWSRLVELKSINNPRSLLPNRRLPNTDLAILLSTTWMNKSSIGWTEVRLTPMVFLCEARPSRSIELKISGKMMSGPRGNASLCGIKM